MPNPVRQHLTGSATVRVRGGHPDMQQREVVHDVCDVWVFERIATQVDGKVLPVRADAWRRAAEPL